MRGGDGVNCPMCNNKRPVVDSTLYWDAEHPYVIKCSKGHVFIVSTEVTA